VSDAFSKEIKVKRQRTESSTRATLWGSKGSSIFTVLIAYLLLNIVAINVSNIIFFAYLDLATCG
jgi:hypothetical protein